MLKRMVLVAAAVIAALSLVAGPASARTGPGYYSSAQVGYAVTGAEFSYAGAHVTLPDASRFSRELGMVEFGAQLWNSSTVIDVGAVACTDSTCKPGGKPVVRYYRPVLRIFSRKTGKLICSAALGNCGNPSSMDWAHASFRPGTSIDIDVVFETVYGTVTAFVGSAFYDAWPLPAGMTFGQARIAADFGPTPLAAAPFRAPARPVKLATFFEGPGPEFEAEVAASNKPWSACIGAPVFTRHVLVLTKAGAATHVRARPGGLSGYPGGVSGGGCNFSVFLEPL